MRPSQLPLCVLCLALSYLQADGFVLHLRTDCPLSAGGQVLGANWTLAFNKAPFICYDSDAQMFTPCGMGASFPWNYSTEFIAYQLNQPQLERLIQPTRKSCQQQIQSLWGRTGARQRPPNVRISTVTPQNTPFPTMLACNVWGFYPEKVAVGWLWNGEPMEQGAGPLVVRSNGDWTFQARRTLPVDPQRGGVYTCLVSHPSLKEPLTDDWAAGLPLDLRVQVGISVSTLAVGIALLIAGLIYWRKVAQEGYIPIEGNSYSEGQ
uniref:Major histocompatibility complex, class II, DM beta n=1 Tax=Salvator merianae TaxID=96440 RepID=A0A8D0B8T9_SALMN